MCNESGKKHVCIMSAWWLMKCEARTNGLVSVNEEDD